MGAGTYDPRNHLGAKPPVTLPLALRPTPHVWSAQDVWFVTVNGADELPDMAIGRLPAATATELEAMVQKTMTFEKGVPVTNATLVADEKDGTSDFKTAATNWIRPRLFAAGYALSAQYLDDLPATNIRGQTRNTLNGGRHLLTYFGHGSEVLWSAKDLWNTNDVRLLTNTVYHLVAVFSCQSGAFGHPKGDCLGEAFVKRPNHGAAAFAGPTSLSVQIFAEKMADGFFAEFANTTTRLGDSLEAGRLRTWTYNPNACEVKTYGILGDPALRKYGR